MTESASSQFTDPRIANYLDALSRALYGLPDDVRGEVYDEIRQHIDDELAQHGGDASAIPGILERLGDPAAIAREAGAPVMPRPARPGRGQEITAVILLAVGGFAIGIGWIVGVVLLWASNRFTRADKIIGTLLVPGGFATALVFLAVGAVVPATVHTCVSGGTTTSLGSGIVSTTTSCTGGSSTTTTVIVILIAVLVLLGPVYTTIRLSRRVSTM